MGKKRKAFDPRKSVRMVMSACHGKSAYSNHGQAMHRAKRARDKYEERLVPYHCPICHQWHLGEERQRKRPLKDL